MWKKHNKVLCLEGSRLSSALDKENEDREKGIRATNGFQLVYFMIHEYTYSITAWSMHKK